MKIAINGYGRIGRSFVRALLDRQAAGEPVPFQLVAINDLGDPEALLLLTRYDTTHGRCPVAVALDGDHLLLGDQRPRLLHEADPRRLPWRELQVDLVLECTGVFRGRDEAAGHLQAGAGRVIIGAVPFNEVDALVVYGINHEQVPASARILSAASCTTHAAAPLLDQLHRHWGIEDVLLTEVHAYTSDQTVLDHVHRDPRRGRAAAQNIVPTSSSAIGALQQVLPALAGRISGGSIRVPTLNVALLDLTVRLTRAATEEQINALFLARAGEPAGQIGYNAEPLVSTDFNHRPESVIFDATQTRRQGALLRLAGWYDNEWGYARRLLDWVTWLARTDSPTD